MPATVTPIKSARMLNCREGVCEFDFIKQSPSQRIEFKNKNISDILGMTVSEALVFFADIPKLARILRTLEDVGMGYVQLGQQATTLSGGEAQRIKLAQELSKPASGKTLYILDEPTVGLHMADVARLPDVRSSAIIIALSSSVISRATLAVIA